MQNELDKCREELDRINQELLTLHKKRLSIVKQVADYKIKNHQSVFCADREQNIIDTMCENASDEEKGGIELLFKTLMRISRESQYELMYRNSEYFKSLTDMRESVRPATVHIVACQGVEGAYSGQCAKELFSGQSIHYYETFSDVFSAIANDEADAGVLPIENSYAGSILPVFDLMKKHTCYIYQSHKIRISHCLLGLPGTKLSDITEVYSHAQGLSQCREWLDAHKAITPHEYSNTAAAAQFVKHSGQRNRAAIASMDCCNVYGLSPILENIQDSQDNYTRFITITKRFHLHQKANKICVLFTLPNETGSLNDILSRFAICGLNMTKLESRPLNSMFSYLFFMEFEGNVFHQNVIKLLCELYEELNHFVFLGNYYDDTHIYES